jgi:hypothetical protein
MGRFVFALAIVSVLGLAATATAGAQIKIGFVQYDSPGSDTGSNASLNGEYVKIKNTGTRARVLTGWRLHDNQHHRYTFGTFTLCGGCHVNIRTGHGTDTAKNHFWGMSNYVWNNTGDKATLVRAGGRVVDFCKWGESGPGFKKC